MKLFYLSIIFSFLIAQDQTFKLQDGTIIVGSVIEETKTNYKIKTKYGEVNINKDDLVLTQYEIKLKTGETFSGIKLSETDTSIKLQTKLGELDFNKSDIIDFKESEKISIKSNNKNNSNYRKNYSLQDVFFGTGAKNKLSKDIEFAMGEEQLTSLFFDPTAYVLDEGTLYLSGLSFAFGLSEKLQISSRWVDFFWGNFNIRPKYRLFHKGNWEKESALSIGGHFHTYWQPNRVVWQSGKLETNDGGDYYYGGYFPLGSTININNGYNTSDYHSCSDCNNGLNVKQTDDLDFMFELFASYTNSKARKRLKGRISNTVGAVIQVPINEGYEMPYRVYWGVDLDLTPQLKIIWETFYDPFFLDLNHRESNDYCEGPFECFAGSYAAKTSIENPIKKDDFNSIRPIHFDIGFIYAVNENFRIGIHTQPYIIAFYWKF